MFQKGNMNKMRYFSMKLSTKRIIENFGECLSIKEINLFSTVNNFP